MSTNNDGYEALTAGDSRDDLAGTTAGGGGGGAALGVLLTLVIGCGLVFAAYKLGQRTSVDEPPTILADGGPAKMVPLDEGGTVIPNTDNDAYTMVDGSNSPDRVSYVERDGIIVEEQLASRQLAPVDPLAGGEAQQDVISVSDLRPVGSIAGEPSLTSGAAPDRADERLLAGGAEVSITNAEAILSAAEREAAGAAQGGFDATASIANSAQNGLTGAGAAVAGAVGSTFVTDGQLPSTQLSNTQGIRVPDPNALNRPALNPNALTTGVDTVVAVAPAPVPAPAPPTELSPETFGSGLIVPLPRLKPDLGPRIAAVERARSTVQPRIVREPAAATTLEIPQAQPGFAAAPVLQAQPVGIPPQPVGDAQVQLGAMGSPNEVRERWRQLQGSNPDVLGNLGLQVLPVRTAQGQELFRLRVGPLPDSQTAARLCDQLRFRGIECFVPAR